MREVGIDLFPDIEHGDISGGLIRHEAKSGGDDEIAPLSDGGVTDGVARAGGVGFDVKTLQGPIEWTDIATGQDSGFTAVPGIG